jgi:Fur family ferric uptake transcriptional regulator
MSAPNAHPLHETLRSRGYRITPQRQLVLDALVALEHATPDEIASEVQGGGVNLSTVYRTLELLEEVGLVTHTHLGHGAPTYHAAAVADHLHLVCRDCGGVTETDVELADPLVEALRSRHAFQTDVAHFAVYGRCKDCAG